MDPRPTILPPNASALMRAVDQAVPRWDALPGALRGNIYGHSDALETWLAGEWGLSQFARYFNGNTGQLLQTGVPWLRERGTPAAVRRALGWLGFTGVTIQEDGARLHIDPGQNVTAEQVRDMAHVVRASVPAHVHFYRVFHGLDVRPFIWGRSRWGHAVWQAESGEPIAVDPWGEPIIVSQQSAYRFNGQQAAGAVGFALRERWTFIAKGASEWRWGHARYGHAISQSLRRSRSLLRDHFALQLARLSPPRAVFQLQDAYPYISHQAPAAPAHTALALHFGAHTQAAHSTPTWRGRWDERTWRASTPFNFTVSPAP